MKSITRELLVIGFILIIGIYFSVRGVIEAQSFLAPLAVAGLLGMIFLPMSRRMEHMGLTRGWSALLSVLTAIAFFAGLFFLISLQVQRISEDWPQIKQRLEPKLEQLQDWIEEKSGIEPGAQKEMIKKHLPGSQQGDSAPDKPTSGSGSQHQNSEASTSGSSLMDTIGNLLKGFFSFLATALLTGVYLFFMLLYRSKVKKSVLKFFPADKRGQADGVLQHSVKLAQSYLIGRFWLIIILAALYSIGLYLSGVRHAVLISILAALLSLIPYIGNVAGFLLAEALAVFSGVDVMGYIGVAATFGIAQFVESYMLEPYIVGHKVELNPLATILVVVLGGAVWGIIGMIIFIPLFGIIKIVCDNIPVLQPVGYLLGEEDIASSQHENRLKRFGRNIRDRIRRKKNS